MKPNSAENSPDISENSPRAEEPLRLDLEGLEIDDLEISEFLDETLVQQGEAVSKVMAASCTTCECCCSCVLLHHEVRPQDQWIEKEFTPQQLAKVRSHDP